MAPAGRVTPVTREVMEEEGVGVGGGERTASRAGRGRTGGSIKEVCVAVVRACVLGWGVVCVLGWGIV